VRQVVGVDLTPSLLELGAKRLLDAGVSNVLLQEGNAQSLPFVDGSFDVVFCRSSLHHLIDPRRAVAEMVRTCRPGGRVVVADLIAPSAEERDTFDHVHRLIDPSHVRTFLEGELGNLFPGEFTLTYGETTTLRAPIDISLTEQSDRDTVVAALRGEIGGGEPTGFDPAEEDGALVVSFTSCVVHGTRG
jgi:SAM-dependent methyltransferase